MDITRDNRKPCRVAGVAFLIIGIAIFVECIALILPSSNDFGIVAMFSAGSIFFISLGVLGLFTSGSVTKYDETGIYVIKDGVPLSTTYWDDYEAAYFRILYKGQLEIILSPRKLSVEERRSITSRFRKENSIHSLLFESVLMRSKKDKEQINEIIRFIEKKYGVSYEKSMSRSARTFE